MEVLFYHTYNGRIVRQHELSAEALAPCAPADSLTLLRFQPLQSACCLRPLSATCTALALGYSGEV